MKHLTIINRNGKLQTYPAQVHDLYKIATAEPVRDMTWGSGESCSDQIIESWHMLHDLVNALQGIEQAEIIGFTVNTIYWPGYGEGAIPSDDPDIARVSRCDDTGNLYVFGKAGDIYNVHPKVTQAGNDDDGVTHFGPGVYPVRWKLDDYEVAELLQKEHNAQAGGEA